MSDGNAGRPKSAAARPAVEWVVGGISCLVAVALIVFLAYRALFHDARPADLSVAVEGWERTARGTTVTVAVSNDGEMAAAAIVVQAVRADAPDAPSRRIEFDYVAGRAIRRGAFVFPGTALAPGSVAVEIVGFVEP